MDGGTQDMPGALALLAVHGLDLVLVACLLAHIVEDRRGLVDALANQGDSRRCPRGTARAADVEFDIPARQTLLRALAPCTQSICPAVSVQVRLRFALQRRQPPQSRPPPCLRTAG